MSSQALGAAIGISYLWVAVAESLILAILALLVFGLRRTVAGLRDAFEETDTVQEEYWRALSDYERLTRHRLANPLAALRGGIATLREVSTLSEGERDLLLEMLEREAKRLENICLDPRRLAGEERDLRPLPCAKVSDAA